MPPDDRTLCQRELEGSEEREIERVRLTHLARENHVRNFGVALDVVHHFATVVLDQLRESARGVARDRAVKDEDESFEEFRPGEVGERLALLETHVGHLGRVAARVEFGASRVRE